MQFYTAFSFENDVELSVAIDRNERCLVDIFNWMAVNKLKFNRDKTLLEVHQSQFRSMSLRPFITVGVDTIVETKMILALAALGQELGPVGYQDRFFISSVSCLFCFYCLDWLAGAIDFRLPKPIVFIRL